MCVSCAPALPSFSRGRDAESHSSSSSLSVQEWMPGAAAGSATGSLLVTQDMRTKAERSWLNGEHAE